MRKIWTLAWKDIYGTYRDRNLVLIMIAAPLAVATIVGLAFGNVGGSDVPIRDIPVAIVNQDAGVSIMGSEQNYGAIFVSAFVPAGDGSPSSGESGAAACPAAEGNPGAGGDPNILFDLTEAVTLDDLAAKLADCIAKGNPLAYR